MTDSQNPTTQPPPTTTTTSNLDNVADTLRELAKAFNAHLAFLAGALRRALLPMYAVAFFGLATIVLSSLMLWQVMLTRERIEALAGRVESLTVSVERVERTAESTQTKVDETQTTLAEGPSVDIEVRTATSATPSATAVKATAVLVVRPRKPPPVTSALAPHVPSVEIPLPLPSADTTEKRKP